jgi:ribosomal protein L37AE/L43A
VRGGRDGRGGREGRGGRGSADGASIVRESSAYPTPRCSRCYSADHRYYDCRSWKCEKCGAKLSENQNPDTRACQVSKRARVGFTNA